MGRKIPGRKRLTPFVFHYNQSANSSFLEEKLNLDFFQSTSYTTHEKYHLQEPPKHKNLQNCKKKIQNHD